MRDETGFIAVLLMLLGAMLAILGATYLAQIGQEGCITLSLVACFLGGLAYAIWRGKSVE